MAALTALALLANATMPPGLRGGAPLPLVPNDFDDGVYTNSTVGLLSYDVSMVQKQLNLCQASYCLDTVSWNCKTCDPGITLEAVIEDKGTGGRALVGYNGNTKRLFVAYRGSSNIPNWIENVKFVLTTPYLDMPSVKVEKGFYQWYTSLKSGVDSALLASKSKHGVSAVEVTGHSAGGACATLHAFDIARGESATKGLTLAQVVTFGSPRVGNTDFYSAHKQ